MSKDASDFVTAVWDTFWLPQVAVYQHHEQASLYSTTPTFARSVAEFKLPGPIAAPWLGAVQRRLELSAASEGEGDDSTTIPNGIASSAIQFFESTSDLLPGEPYLYPSSRRDLVAEFEGTRGRMTSIVGNDYVIIHAVVDGKVIQFELPLRDDEDQIRQSLNDISTKLLSRDHGKAVDSGRR